MPEKNAVELDDAVLERLERYVVQGDDGLRDPVLAQLVATYPRLVPQLRDIVAGLRMRSRAAAETSLAGAIRRLGREPVLGTPTLRTTRQKMDSGQPLRRKAWYGIGSTLVGVLLVALGWTAVASRQHLSSLRAIYATANGQRATITMTDGSTVMLNVASRLEVPADYAAGNHTVRLIGEGLFTIAHRDGTPLTVLAGATATRVLGTSFVVRHYANDTTTLVAVREGKVAVGSTVVTAAHMVDMDRAGIPTVRPADASMFSFTTGLLTLDTLPLSAAIAELDRWYAADIRLGSPALAALRVQGEFAAGSLADLATMLEMTFDVRVVRNGRILTLYPRQ
ncbi:MAG TPA: FecR domain-containing protein [Gemmatimonadaceae bacterium]|nr:FecR domain-containing protein [Gemmatimonadaceae bacterium]